MGNLLSANRVRFEPIRSLDWSLIDTLSFTGVGLPFSNPVRLLHIINFTDSNLLISFDGITPHTAVAKHGFVLYDYSSNKSEQSGFLEQAVGDRVYVEAETALPTSGGVYAAVMYASQT